MKRITAKHKSLTISEAFEEFITTCRLKNLSDASLTHYKYCQLRFSKYCDTQSPIDLVSRDTITGFTADMVKNGLKPASININLGGVRAFLYYCMECEYLSPFKIKLVKVDETEKPVYSEMELLELLKKPETDKFNEVRNWVIINYAIATGNRVNTIRNLKIGDILLDESAVNIKKQKNRKVVKLPIGDSLVSILKKYIKTYFPDATPDMPLFPSCFGNIMSTTSVEQIIRLYNQKHGVTTSSMHAFRRAYAKLFIKNHGSIEQLKEYMQHSSITMTERYYKLYCEDLRENYQEYNPLEQLLAQNKKGKYIKARK